MGKSVLVIDDSMYMRTLIKDALEEAGYNIIGQAANGESAIDQAMELNPDLITLDNKYLLIYDIMDLYFFFDLTSFRG